MCDEQPDEVKYVSKRQPAFGGVLKIKGCDQPYLRYPCPATQSYQSSGILEETRHLNVAGG